MIWFKLEELNRHLKSGKLLFSIVEFEVNVVFNEYCIRSDVIDHIKSTSYILNILKLIILKLENEKKNYEMKFS